MQQDAQTQNWSIFVWSSVYIPLGLLVTFYLLSVELIEPMMIHYIVTYCIYLKENI
jgi:hypothetical protein